MRPTRSPWGLLRLLCCSLAFGFLPSLPVEAQPMESPIRLGDYPGLWAGHKVVFSIQETAENTFDGVAEMIDGPFRGLKFGFHGKVNRDLSMVVIRYASGDMQIARPGPPTVFGGRAVWSGDTRGVGILENRPQPFQLFIPIR